MPSDAQLTSTAPIGLPLFDPRPVVLSHDLVRLEPLALGHANDLCAAASQEIESWRYMPVPGLADAATAERWISEANARSAAGGEIAFAIVDGVSGRAVGSTRYLDIRREHRGLEIGYTWLSPDVRRTAVNTICKYLMLCHAFDRLGAIRVQLKTDSRNTRSQTAIERIGAVREGVLRSHMICWDGTLRDSVYYAITRDEWPGIRTKLASLCGATM
ncbi:MAG: GNAT family N-acetyltransferase [Phycisphaerae bacterium]|nr:GNAT family N-acetyltransferase [Phycisphaerae bacterium]